MISRLYGGLQRTLHVSGCVRCKLGQGLLCWSKERKGWIQLLFADFLDPLNPRKFNILL